MPPADRIAWASAVATLVTKRYIELAASELGTVRKDEQARLRLAIQPANGGVGNIGSGVGGVGGGGCLVSDSHKISVQLCLDVQAFGRELATVGVEAWAMAEFALLQDTVGTDATVPTGYGLTHADISGNCRAR